MNIHKILDHELERFIAALGDIPETVIAIHQLRNNIGKAYIVGTLDNFSAAVVQYDMLPQEPIAFGDDAGAIWAILRELHGWDVVEVQPDVAGQLSTIMMDALNSPIKHYEDVYFQLDSRIDHIPPYDESVEIRLLNPGDLAMVERTSMESKPIILGTIEKTLRESIVAGGIVAGELVAFSESRSSSNYVELGVMTDPAWQNRGLASALASLLILHHQPSGLIPTWSTGEDNLASQRVAKKLGFREIMRRIYLIT